MIIPLSPANDQLLKTPTVDFDFSKDDAQEVFTNLKETMIHHRGLGLSANQVRLPHRVFVLGNPDDPDSVFGMFNPNIVSFSDEVEYLEEGCLTFPGLYVKVKRPKSIRVRFQRLDGEIHTEKFDGMTARVIQHEIDHLDGIVHISRATSYHREKAYKQQAKLNKMRKEYVRSFGNSPAKSIIKRT